MSYWYKSIKKLVLAIQFSPSFRINNMFISKVLIVVIAIAILAAEAKMKKPKDQDKEERPKLPAKLKKKFFDDTCQPACDEGFGFSILVDKNAECPTNATFEDVVSKGVEKEDFCTDTKVSKYLRSFLTNQFMPVLFE